MNFAATVGSPLGPATPSLSTDLTIAYYWTNRRVIHLSETKRCLDQAGHLFGYRVP
jgi:hypothetical protein